MAEVVLENVRESNERTLSYEFHVSSDLEWFFFDATYRSCCTRVRSFDRVTGLRVAKFVELWDYGMGLAAVMHQKCSGTPTRAPMTVGAHQSLRIASF